MVMVFLTIQVVTFLELKQGIQEFWTRQSAALKNLRFKKQYEVKWGSKKANQIEREWSRTGRRNMDQKKIKEEEKTGRNSKKRVALTNGHRVVTVFPAS